MKQPILMILLCLVTGLWGCTPPKDGEATPSTEEAPVVAPAPTRRAIRVEAAVVQPSSAQLAVTLPGEVEGWRDTLLAAPMGGVVERLKVEAGDRVRKNQLLARVDGRLHQAQMAQTRVARNTARVEAERALRLGDAIPSAQRDAAESQLASARAAHSAAAVTARRSTMRAPFAGTVASVDIERGEFAPPGQPIIRLVQLDRVRVTLAVSDRDVVNLRVGMPAEVRTDALGGFAAATISRVSPAANMRTRAFEVDVEVPNEDGKLLPGMIATVTIAMRNDGDAIVLPQDAIVTQLRSNGVFVAETEGDTTVARFREVTLGRVMRHQVVVESGLEAGATIIVTGHRELADGDPLIVTRTGRCCSEGRVRFGS